MTTRPAFRAGSFYEGSPAACQAHAERLLASVDLPDDLPQALFGGLVPHAGWVYSGRLAATTLRALDAAGKPDSIVLLGADHCGTVARGEVYDCGAWATPLGPAPIDADLAADLIAASPLLRANPAAHAREHSLEVQVPLIQALWGQCPIVPIAVGPSPDAVAIGRAIGTALAARESRTYVIGSTDLTHHGGHFPAPGGRGETGEAWTAANDRRMLDLIESLDADAIVPEALTRHNACGAGAIAAALSACRSLGATAARCLTYTNSYRIVHASYPNDPDDTTVGYASVVFAA